MLKRAALLITTLLFFWSCGESSLLLGEVDEPAQIQVATVDSGAVLSSGADVPVRIERDPVYVGDETSADRLVVELYDHVDTLLAEQSFDSVDQAAELPSIQLPELPEGLYKLQTSYFDGEELVAQESAYFFIADGSYEIVGLTSYPASSHPEADGLLRLSLEIPPQTDPFLVWRLGDRVIESGYLSETGTSIAVLAPASQGVYPVGVDLYPVWPQGADPGIVEPAATYSTDLYVSNSPVPARTDLLPEENYFALYHFRGSLRDDGARAEWFPSNDFAARAIGSPALAASSDLFGYRLDGASGFQIDGVVWPVFDDELSPVSITFRVTPEQLVERATLLEIDLRSSRLLSVAVDAEGRVGLGLGMLADEVWTPVPLLAQGVPETVAVSIVPGEEVSMIRFFAGGQLVYVREVPAITLGALGSPRIVSGADRWAMLDGVTTLGSETDGFQGIVDEFGVFFRDEANQPATNTTLFQDTMRSEYGDRLLYAASFEHADEIDDLRTDGSVLVENGSLVLSPGSLAGFPEFLFADEDLVIQLEIALDAPAELELYPTPEGAAETPVGLAGGDSAFATVTLEPAEDEQNVRLTLTHRDGVLTVFRGENEQIATHSTVDFAGVVVALTVPHDAGAGGRGDEGDVAREPDERSLAGEPDDSGESGAPDDSGGAPDASGAEPSVRLLSIVARRDRPQIPDQLFNVDGD